MNSTFSSLEEALTSVSVQLTNNWIMEFIRLNYLTIIYFLAFFVILWFFGVLIKNSIWKIDRISESLDRIANGIEFFISESEEKIENTKNPIVANKEVKKRLVNKGLDPRV